MTVNSDSIPHGRSTTYIRHKCRCDACREAEVQRQRKWRARHRAGKVVHQPAHPHCVPVRVRGKLYPSISAAAAALGVSPSSIGGQLARRGEADGAGLGHQAPRRKPPVPPNARSCRIHGRDFPSIRAAARYLGVNYSHLYRQLQRGLSGRYAEYLLGKLMAADQSAAITAGGMRRSG